jgi:methylmalonyl-CoA/ethylmalonyl-CoA epimerase
MQVCGNGGAPVSIRKISHIGIAVRDLDRQVALYRDVLGLELLGFEEIEDQQVRVAILRVGESNIELLEPLSDRSPVAKFLERRGQGIHHLAYEVDGIEQILEGLDSDGVELIDRSPRDGAHGKRIAFIHPRSTFGVLTELCE